MTDYLIDRVAHGSALEHRSARRVRTANLSEVLHAVASSLLACPIDIEIVHAYIHVVASTRMSTSRK